MEKDAKDLIMHLLTKDPRRQCSLEDVKRHLWFLVDNESNTGDANRLSVEMCGNLMPHRLR